MAERLYRHTLRHGLHIPHDGRVQNACIVPCHVGIGVSEHLGDILDSRTACESQSSEGMPCAVRREVFPDAADIRQLKYAFIFWLLHTGSRTPCA